MAAQPQPNQGWASVSKLPIAACLASNCALDQLPPRRAVHVMWYRSGKVLFDWVFRCPPC